MTPAEYIEACKRTESVKLAAEALGADVSFEPHEAMSLINKKNAMLHGVMGMVTESAEALDAFKKHFFYGSELDRTNLIEEIGDILWYVSIMLSAAGSTYEEVMEINIAKLRARFPEKFTEENAINRDLDRERAILEDGHISGIS